MTLNYSEMLGHMGPAAVAVALVLVIMGLASLTVFAERLLTLSRSRSESKQFAAKIGADLANGRFRNVLDLATGEKRAHLARVVRAGVETYWNAASTTDIVGVAPLEKTRRHLERYMEEIGADLRAGLSVLSTVGSTAPFIGLLGTVLGILKAFQSIAATGSGGLSSVAAGIAEALVETALGLAVAIPAVLAYNYLSTRIARDETSLHRAAGELIDAIEDWEERQQHVEVRRGRVA